MKLQHSKKNLFSVKSLISYQLKLNCIFVNLNHLEIFHTSENTEKKYFHDCKKVRKMCLQFDYKKLLLSDVRRGERQGILFFFLNYLISSVSSGFQWTEFDGFTITFLISFEKRQFIVWMGTTWHIYLSQWVVIWLWFIVWVIKLNCSNILILNCNETCGQIPFFTWKLI